MFLALAHHSLNQLSGTYPLLQDLRLRVIVNGFHGIREVFSSILDVNALKNDTSTAG